VDSLSTNPHGPMPDLTLKDIPESVYKRLKARAENNHRPLEQEATQILEAALIDRSAEDVIARAEALNRRLGRTFPDIVNEAKRKGRA